MKKILLLCIAFLCGAGVWAQDNLSVGRYYYNNKDYARALPHLQQAAKSGSSDAQFMTGCMYYYGRGVDQNQQIGMRMLQMSAAAGNGDANNELGNIFSGSDEAKAAEHYRKAAEKGHVSAMCSLGYCYLFGSGIPEDNMQALLWFKSASEKGSGLAMYFMGLMYHSGWGVAANDDTALSWLDKSFETGHRYYNAVLLAGKIHLAKKNYSKAIPFLKEAADGRTEALILLGDMYRDGSGVTRDKLEALSYYNKAVQQGDALGYYKMGEYYESYHDRPDLSKAFEYYRQAGDRDLPQAFGALARCYYEGVGTPVDYAQAFAWGEKAAAGYDTVGTYYLALCCEHGRGTEADDERARSLFRQAAAGGYQPAEERMQAYEAAARRQLMESLGVASFFDLAEAFLEGRGVERDVQEALVCYDLSATEESNPLAWERMAQLFLEGNGVDQNRLLGVDYLTRAAEGGVASAQARLGEMYYQGVFVSRDKAAAIKWSRKAALQGNIQGQLQYDEYIQYKEVGDPYQGGVVIYVDSTNKHGLAVSTSCVYTRTDQMMIPSPGGSGWRLPTYDELRMIYGMVGNSFAAYGLSWKAGVIYLTSEKIPNPVLPQKPNRRGLNFRDGSVKSIAYGHDAYTIAVCAF